MVTVFGCGKKALQSSARIRYISSLERALEPISLAVILTWVMVVFKLGFEFNVIVASYLIGLDNAKIVVLDTPLIWLD